MRIRLYLHSALWCSLFAVFLWISFPIVGSAVRENRFGPIETNRSIDDYLVALTGIQQAAEKLPDAFRHLGKEGQLIVFARDKDSQGEFLAMLIGYISWPREIQIIKVPGPTVEKEITEINPGLVAGVIFCSVEPPQWLQHRVSLGRNVTLVPVTEATP